MRRGGHGKLDEEGKWYYKQEGTEEGKLFSPPTSLSVKSRENDFYDLFHLEFYILCLHSVTYSTTLVCNKPHIRLAEYRSHRRRLRREPTTPPATCPRTCGCVPCPSAAAAAVWDELSRKGQEKTPSRSFFFYRGFTPRANQPPPPCCC